MALSIRVGSIDAASGDTPNASNQFSIQAESFGFVAATARRCKEGCAMRCVRPALSCDHTGDRPATLPVARHTGGWMPAERRAARRAVVAAIVGNVLEWYDFAVYAYMARLVAKIFFPTGDDVNSLLSTFAAFGVGFVIRP